MFSLYLFFFIIGDFNLHINKPENFYVSKFINILNIFNLTQHVSTPTHTSGNIIDFLIKSSIIKIRNLLTIKFEYSDHYIINFKYFLNCNFNNTIGKPLKRNWKIFNKKSFSGLFKYFDLVVSIMLMNYCHILITLLLLVWFGYCFKNG